MFGLDFHFHVEIAYRTFTRNVPRAELIFVYFQHEDANVNGEYKQICNFLYEGREAGSFYVPLRYRLVVS